VTSLSILWNILDTLSNPWYQSKPQLVQPLKEFPQPRSLKEMQSSLGLANYYRKFIENFSAIAAPLTNSPQNASQIDQPIAIPMEDHFTHSNDLHLYLPHLSIHSQFEGPRTLIYQMEDNPFGDLSNWSPNKYGPIATLTLLPSTMVPDVDQTALIDACTE
jgi:hypothetical protein